MNTTIQHKDLMKMSILTAIEEAKKAAEGFVSQAAAPPAVAPPAVDVNVPTVYNAATGGAVVVQTGAKMSMDDLALDQLSPDYWLKVKPTGLRIGDNTTNFQNLVVEIDLSELALSMMITDGNSNYWKTTDGVTCHGGGTWAAAIGKAQQAKPSARPYQAVDIPMTFVEDVTDAKGNTVAEAGEILGYTTPATCTPVFSKFLKNVARAGLDPKNATVKVQLGFTTKTNKANQEYAVLQFNLITE